MCPRAVLEHLLVRGVDLYIHSGSARLIFLNQLLLELISKEISQAEHRYT